MGDLDDLSAYLISLDSQSAPPDPGGEGEGEGEGEGLVVVPQGTSVVFAGLGVSITLRVSLDGTPPYSYQWYSVYEG